MDAEFEHDALDDHLGHGHLWLHRRIGQREHGDRSTQHNAEVATKLRSSVIETGIRPASANVTNIHRVCTPLIVSIPSNDSLRPSQKFRAGTV